MEYNSVFFSFFCFIYLVGSFIISYLFIYFCVSVRVITDINSLSHLLTLARRTPFCHASSRNT